MKTQIIKIGNSKGIRIPKPILEECGFSKEVEIQIKNKKLIIFSPIKTRIGWKKEFERLTKKNKKDETLRDFENIEHNWDENEWKW